MMTVDNDDDIDNNDSDGTEGLCLVCWHSAG